MILVDSKAINSDSKVWKLLDDSYDILMIMSDWFDRLKLYGIESIRI